MIKKIREKRAENIGLNFPANYMPYVGNWSNISPKTYAKFEAFEHTGKDFISRINFPIRDISGKIVAFQGRHTGADTPKVFIYTTRCLASSLSTSVSSNGRCDSRRGYI